MGKRKRQSQQDTTTDPSLSDPNKKTVNVSKSSAKKKKKKKKKNKKDPSVHHHHHHHHDDHKTNDSTYSSTKQTTPSLDDHPDHAGGSLSLASRLKRERGTAESTPLPPEWSKRHETTQPFLTPDDDDSSLFTSCHRECYRGFSWEHPQDLPESLHTHFNQALDTLYESQLFLYDAVQAGGKRVTPTFVTRTLVGKPGSTYRYLGLRLFSHPWNAVNVDDGNEHERITPTTTTTTSTITQTPPSQAAIQSLVQLGYRKSCAKALLQIGKINQLLTDRTHQRLQTDIAPHVVPEGLVGSAQYSLTLINRMEPTTLKHDLKRETKHGLGKTSVSWHKDSGLADFSSIAVYHTFRPSPPTTTTAAAAQDKSSTTTAEIPWRVGLRVASDNAHAPPALSVPLPNGSLYYLLDDFNHQHEHAVIAGSNHIRYSSTHRVAREGRGTWQYIRDKCLHIVDKRSEGQLPPSKKQKKNKKNELSTTATTTTKHQRKMYLKDMRAQQQLLTEIEFEWLRQWGIQGTLHAELHPYWHTPIQKLMTWFTQLERSCVQMLHVLQEGNKDTLLSEDLYDVTIEALEERRKLRKTWHERLKDPIYKSMPLHMQPLAIKVLDRQPQSHNDNDHDHDHDHDNDDISQPPYQLSENLDQLIAHVRKWRVAFVNSRTTTSTTNTTTNTTGNKKPLDKNKRSNLTKKEKRKVASNWERMQLSMKKTK